MAEVAVDVVREGLTNVRKHAGPVPTDVAVRPAGDGGLTPSGGWRLRCLLPARGGLRDEALRVAGEVPGARQ